MSLAPEGLSWHSILDKTHMWMLHLTTLSSGQPNILQRIAQHSADTELINDSPLMRLSAVRW